MFIWDWELIVLVFFYEQHESTVAMLVIWAAGKHSGLVSSAAWEHAVFSAAVLRRHILGLEIILPGLHDGVHPAPARRVHAPPLGSRVLKPNLKKYESLSIYVYVRLKLKSVKNRFLNQHKIETSLNTVDLRPKLEAVSIF